MLQNENNSAWRCLAGSVLLVVTACGGGSSSDSPAPPPPDPPVTAPSGLSYDSPSTFTIGVPIDPLLPVVSGIVTRYQADPRLPDGLNINSATGEISGTPLLGEPESSFTIIASNSAGNTVFEMLITVLLTRSTEDRDDLFPGAFQVHAIYAVPKGELDQQRDIDGTIEHSLRSSNMFLLKASGSQEFRYDETTESLIDTSFLVLPNDNAHYAAMGVFARNSLEADIAAAGFDDPSKLYLVYYEGTNPEVCGGAPPLGTGDTVSALYLRGSPPGAPECASNAFAAANNDPAGYWEWAAAHELIHALGFVDACSPNHANAHTSDDPSDLMYSGDQPWAPTTVDPGQDDYYGANVPPACSRNLFNSAFLFPQQGNDVPIGF